MMESPVVLGSGHTRSGGRSSAQRRTALGDLRHVGRAQRELGASQKGDDT